MIEKRTTDMHAWELSTIEAMTPPFADVTFFPFQTWVPRGSCSSRTAIRIFGKRGLFFSVEGESTGLARTDLWSGRDTYTYTDVQGVDRMRLIVNLLFRGGKGNVKDS